MIPHKDIINLVHVVFMTPAAMTKLFILPVSLVHLYVYKCIMCISAHPL